MTAGDPMIELDLRAGPVMEPGRLVVAAREPNGAVARGWLITVTPVGSRMSLRKVKAGYSGERVEASLAPGRYVVRVVPKWNAGRVRSGSDPIPRGPSLGVEREVLITAGEETRIEVRFGGSGWVRVLVELGTPSSEAAPRARVTATFDGRDEVHELRFPNGTHPDASEAQKSSTIGTSHGRFDQRGGIIPGLAQLAHKHLDEGRWRLRAELEGYAPAEAVCDVLIDEEVVVRLVLEPLDG